MKTIQQFKAILVDGEVKKTEEIKVKETRLSDPKKVIRNVMDSTATSLIGKGNVALAQAKAKKQSVDIVIWKEIDNATTTATADEAKKEAEATAKKEEAAKAAAEKKAEAEKAKEAAKIKKADEAKAAKEAADAKAQAEAGKKAKSTQADGAEPTKGTDKPS